MPRPLPYRDSQRVGNASGLGAGVIGAVPDGECHGHATMPVDFRLVENPQVGVRLGERLRHIRENRSAVAFDDDNLLLEAGLAGLGIFQSPLHLVAPYIASGQLERVLPAWHLRDWPMHLLTPRPQFLSPRVRAFCNWVMAELGPPDGLNR